MRRQVIYIWGYDIIHECTNVSIVQTVKVKQIVTLNLNCPKYILKQVVVVNIMG